MRIQTLKAKSPLHCDSLALMPALTDGVCKELWKPVGAGIKGQEGLSWVENFAGLLEEEGHSKEGEQHKQKPKGLKAHPHCPEQERQIAQCGWNPRREGGERNLDVILEAKGALKVFQQGSSQVRFLLARSC